MTSSSCETLDGFISGLTSKRLFYKVLRRKKSLIAIQNITTVTVSNCTYDTCIQTFEASEVMKQKTSHMLKLVQDLSKTAEGNPPSGSAHHQLKKHAGDEDLILAVGALIQFALNAAQISVSVF